YPNNRFLLVSPTHPTLYVGGDGGVFRSVDKGKTWSLFPSLTDGAAQAGGELPHVDVTDLALVQGDINPATGQLVPNSVQSTLLATTAGRGAFAIQLSPAPGASGPQVISLTPEQNDPAGPNAMSAVIVAFNGPVDPSTFTLADVTFTSPTGTPI